VARIDTLADELIVRRLDVRDDKETSSRTGGSRSEADAELDRARGARRGELDHPEVLVPEVRVQPPSEALVELLGAVDIRDGDDDGLELHVDSPAARVTAHGCPPNAASANDRRASAPAGQPAVHCPTSCWPPSMSKVVPVIA